MRIQKTIVTARLSLEKLNPDDYDFIKTLVNSNGWIENIGDRNIHSDKEAIEYIDKILGTENLYYWVLRLNEDNTPIGITSFLKRSYLDHFDLGFALLPDFSNKGYAYEATNAVLQLVSKLPEHNIVLATTLSSNKNSIKLLTKLGFRFEKEIEIYNVTLHIYTNSPGR
jgi:[ribosomal protein S5]-alanine N-acetyltransferase